LKGDYEMDIDVDTKRTIKNIKENKNIPLALDNGSMSNVDSDSVTIDGKPLQQFIIDTVIDCVRKCVVNSNLETHSFYEQQQCIINDEEVARQCTQAQKAQIEEMQRRIAELNVNALVIKTKNDLMNEI
jgi:hypothetical protein